MDGKNLNLVINYYRLKKGFTQKEMVKGIVSQSHMSNILKGRYPIEKNTLELIFEKISVPFFYGNMKIIVRVSVC